MPAQTEASQAGGSSSGSEAPAPVDTDNDVRAEITDLRLEVHGVHNFQKGLTAFLLIVSVFAAIIIASLGWLGISGLIDRAVEKRVGDTVDKSLEQIRGIAYTAESLGLRVELAATSSALSAETAQAALGSFSIASTETAVAAGTGEWIVVVSAVSDQEDALSEVSRILRAGYPSSIYKLGDDFAISLGTYPSESEAKTASLAVRSTLRVSPDIFNLIEVCPFREYLPAGYFACYLRPIPTPTP